MKKYIILALLGLSISNTSTIRSWNYLIDFDAMQPCSFNILDTPEGEPDLHFLYTLPLGGAIMLLCSSLMDSYGVSKKTKSFIADFCAVGFIGLFCGLILIKAIKRSGDNDKKSHYCSKSKQKVENEERNHQDSE